MSTPYDVKPTRPYVSSADACAPGARGVNSAWFFPRVGFAGNGDRVRAQQVCRTCPLVNQRQCFMRALADGSEWGVWGGIDFREAAKRAGDKKKHGASASTSSEARAMRAAWEVGA